MGNYEREMLRASLEEKLRKKYPDETDEWVESRAGALVEKKLGPSVPDSSSTDSDGVGRPERQANALPAVATSKTGEQLLAVLSGISLVGWIISWIPRAGVKSAMQASQVLDESRNWAISFAIWTILLLLLRGTRLITRAVYETRSGSAPGA
jgi:hypothetical protein